MPGLSEDRRLERQRVSNRFSPELSARKRASATIRITLLICLGASDRRVQLALERMGDVAVVKKPASTSEESEIVVCDSASGSKSSVTT